VDHCGQETIRNRKEILKMHTLRNKLIALAAVMATVALVFTITAEFKAHATPPSKLVNIPLARGTNLSEGTIPLHSGTDVAMAQITVDPGGSSGWHSHPGGAIIVVKTGTLNVYRSVGGQCQTETYSAGQAFIERPGELDNVLNRSSSDYILYVTFPRVPQGVSPRTDEPNPGTCPGV